jgi:GT2 family glycosyltransferase
MVCVVITNYNGWEQLQYALPSIRQTTYLNYQLAVVDDGSTDESLAGLKRDFPDVTVLPHRRNRGYAAACNTGIRWALEQNAAYLGIFNNDMQWYPAWLDQAIDTLEQHPEAVMLGLTVVGDGVRGDEGDFEARWRSLVKPRVWETDNVKGGATIARTEVYRQVGLIDEVYFAYAEENDFQWRVRAAGFRMLNCDIPVWHESGGFFGRVKLRASRLAMRNNLRFYYKTADLKTSLRMTLATASLAFNPFLNVDTSNAITRRMRPSNLLVNAGIFAYALGWNLKELPRTLRLRAEERRLIARSRRSRGLE